MHFLFFIGFTSATAVLPLLFVLGKVIGALVQTRQKRQMSVETKARILYVHVVNERGRTVPFVKLKVEVFARSGEPFIADAEGFYSHDELQGVKTGAIVFVRYQPNDKTQLRILKKRLETVKEWRLFVKEGGEIISAKRGQTQSPEARHRRLVSQ